MATPQLSVYVGNNADKQSKKPKPQIKVYKSMRYRTTSNFSVTAELKSSILKHFNSDVLLSIMSDDGLQIDSECSVCELFLSWLAKVTQNGRIEHNLEKLLSCIRWSDIDHDFMNARLLKNELIASNEESKLFLQKVDTYFKCGIHFTNLRTFSRPSTGNEKVLIVLGLYLDESDSHTSTPVNCISLQSSGKNVEIIPPLPVKFFPNTESTMCVKDKVLYVTGVGEKKNEIWKFRVGDSTWVKCKNMIRGRKRHVMAFVNDTLYICGGCDPDTEIKLRDITKYNATDDNTSSVTAQLIHAVEHAAIASYNGSIFVFGGKGDPNENVSYVQVYNTKQNTCMLASPMPYAYRLMRAVVWEEKAILLGAYNCFIYSFCSGKWEQRTQYKTGVHEFGLVIENQQIYVIGGGVEKSGAGGPNLPDDSQHIDSECNSWQLKAEIKNVEVNKIINDDKLACWQTCTRLPTCSLVNSCATMTIQAEKNSNNAPTWPDVLVSTSILQHVTEECVANILNDDNSQIDDEEQLCNYLIQYLSTLNEVGRPMANPIHLLSHICWSGISQTFLESTLKNSLYKVCKKCKCDEFLRNIVAYFDSNVHFENLRTLTRPSSSLVRCFVIAGIDSNLNVVSNVAYRVSLQSPESVQKLPPIPTEIPAESAACVKRNILYITGIGELCNEIWSYEDKKGWNRIATMEKSRRRHCITFLDEILYLCGGVEESENKILRDIEKCQIYSEHTKCQFIGNMCEAVENAACVAANDKKALYIFGGFSSSQNDAVDYVQVYDTKTDSCVILEDRLPSRSRLLRAVLWEDSVILLGKHTCFTYNLVNKSCEEKDNFGTGFEYFGVAIENKHIYIVGGGIETEEATPSWIYMKEVKFTEIKNLIENVKSLTWTHQADLPIGSLVHSFAVLTLTTHPVEKRQKGAQFSRSARNSSQRPLTAFSLYRPREPENQDDVINAVKTLIDCTICRDTLKNPRMLPCGHTFCLQCLETLCSRTKPGEKFRCSNCTTEVPLPLGGAKRFPSNYTVSGLLDSNIMRQSILCRNERTTPSSSNPPNTSARTSFPHAEMACMSKIVTSTIGRRITGITKVDNNIYIVSEWQNMIEVFDRITNELSDSIKVKELHHPKDIASFETNIFIMDSKIKNKRERTRIWKCQMKPKKIKKWLRNIDEPFSFSISETGGLHLLQKKDSKSERWQLNIYAANSWSAKLPKSINLNSEIKCPKHAIQLSNGQFAICYGAGRNDDDATWSTWTICMVNTGGVTTKTLTPTVPLQGPLYYLATDQNDNIYVSEGQTKRMLQVNSTLTTVHVLNNENVPEISSWSPFKIYFDKGENQLMIGHTNSTMHIVTITEETIC